MHVNPPLQVRYILYMKLIGIVPNKFYPEYPQDRIPMENLTLFQLVQVFLVFDQFFKILSASEYACEKVERLLWQSEEKQFNKLPNTISTMEANGRVGIFKEKNQKEGFLKNKRKSSSSKMTDLTALEFEVHGKVQGVYFRKFTQSKSKELGLHGWVKNTEKGTVVGELEGHSEKVKQMKKWLRETGSPKSQITRAEFQNERNIPKFTMSSFEIRK